MTRPIDAASIRAPVDPARSLRKVRRRRPAPSLAELPEVLTVEEAAAYLRIARGSAYEMARKWRMTNGQEGLPVIMLGRTLRVPRVALARLTMGTAPQGD